MSAHKIHELTFTQFAFAMVPSWGMSLTNPLDVQPSPAQWLASLWDSADKRVTISIRWRDTPLKKELPPAALEYRFDDLSLQASTRALGLDAGVHADLRKVGELLATRNAWISAIEQHCRQSADLLVDDVAQDYVRLNCHWLQHPWVRDSVRRHKIEQAAEKYAQTHRSAGAPGMSCDPISSSPQAIHGDGDPRTPTTEAECQKAKPSLAQWIREFESVDQRWSSVFEIYAWDAQSDMDVAHRKITGLQAIIEQQQVLIRGFERVIKVNKRREAELSGADKSGRPPKSAQRQEVALQFTVLWVQSLMDAFQVSSCAQLEAMVAGSSQRNWNRWLRGQAVPTSNSFAALQASKITRGPYEGQPLQAVETSPASSDMLTLIRLAGVAPKPSAWD